MGFFGFGKKKAAAKLAMSKMENKDEFEAVCWGGVGIIFADGSKDDSEVEALKESIRVDENMDAFQGEVDSTIDNIIIKFEVSPSRAKLQVIRELSDLKADQEAKENVFATLFDLAAMGDLEESEKAVLKQYANALGVSTSPYGF